MRHERRMWHNSNTQHGTTPFLCCLLLTMTGTQMMLHNPCFCCCSIGGGGNSKSWIGIRPSHHDPLICRKWEASFLWAFTDSRPGIVAGSGWALPWVAVVEQKGDLAHPEIQMDYYDRIAQAFFALVARTEEIYHKIRIISILTVGPRDYIHTLAGYWILSGVM